MFVVVSFHEGLLYSDHFCYATTVVRNLIAVADFYTVAAIALSRTIGILREREAAKLDKDPRSLTYFFLKCTRVVKKMRPRLRELAPMARGTMQPTGCPKVRAHT